jgi:hypothetical protein
MSVSPAAAAAAAAAAKNNDPSGGSAPSSSSSSRALDAIPDPFERMMTFESAEPDDADPRSLLGEVLRWWSTNDEFKSVVHSLTTAQLKRVWSKLNFPARQGRGATAVMRSELIEAIVATQRGLPLAAIVPQADEDEDEEEEEEDAASPAAAAKRRTSNKTSSAASAAAASASSSVPVLKPALKPGRSRVSKSSSSSAASPSSSPAMPEADVLAAIAHLPSDPRDSSRDSSPERKRKKSKRGKRAKEHGKESRRDSRKSSKHNLKHERSRKKHSSKSKHRDSDDDSDSDSDGGSSSSSSSPSSSSSSSDAGSDSDADPRLTYAQPRSRAAKESESNMMDETGLARPMAPKWIRNVLAAVGPGGSIFKLFKDEMHFEKERNRRECMALARVLDHALRDDMEHVKECLVRRLAGVHAADMTDDWGLCDQFELVLDKQSFVPDDFMQKAVKNVLRNRALNGGASGTSFARGGKQGLQSASTRTQPNKKQRAAAGKQRKPYAPGGTGADRRSSSHKKDAHSKQRSADSEE